MKCLPARWPDSAEAAAFWSRLRAARRSVLMLDYDGTLAPFRNERLDAYPYPGVGDRLAALSTHPGVRLALVSGRPARELHGMLATLPGFGGRIEIWGDHGQERLREDSSYSLREVGAVERRVMDLAKEEVSRLGFSSAIEAKPASLAVHWRALPPGDRIRLRSAVEKLYVEHGHDTGLGLLEFDGGIELRLRNGGKGHAVTQILSEEPPGIPAAYLGDDVTDEDAFRAAGRQTLSILVRVEPRESSARFWLKPPEDLLTFLDSWIQASDPKGSRP